MSDGDRARRAPAAVLWDMDGTLVDTEPYWIAEEYELVAEHGGTWNDDHAHAIVGMDLRDAAAYIGEHGSVDLPVDDIVNRLLDGVTLRVRQRVPWRPGARELLADLRAAGVPTALVTMSWRRFAEAVVEALPADSFDVIVAGDEVANGKPHPEPYRRAAERLDVDTADCVAIEDSPTGLRSAVDAGCRALVVPNVVEIEPDPAYTIVATLAGLGTADLAGLAGMAVGNGRVDDGLTGLGDDIAGLAGAGPADTDDDTDLLDDDLTAGDDGADLAGDDEADLAGGGDDFAGLADLKDDFDGLAGDGPAGADAGIEPATTSTADATPPSIAEPPTDESAGAHATHVRRRRIVAAAVAVLALVVAGIVVAVTRDESAAPPPPPDVPIDGWAPYWALEVAEAGVATYGTWLREVSPFWFQATGATSIVEHDNVPADQAATFVKTARSAGAAIVPSVTDGMQPGQMAAILADPAQRSAHVAALVAFVTGGDYAGVDLDYESFAFFDGRSTWATTRPNWVAFVSELAAALHADGKTLTVSIPPILDDGGETDRGYWVYGYAAIGEVVDHIRIMAYDYSTSEPGPVAPLSYVRQAIAAAKHAVGDDSKLVLGVPLGGYNWPVSTDGTCPTNVDTGRTSVTQATVDDLLARRQATPVHDPVTGEASFTYTATFTDGTASCTQTREAHYVDAEGTAARVDLARTEGLGGASLWALGYDSPATWTAIGGLARPDNGQGTVATTPASAPVSSVLAG